MHSGISQVRELCLVYHVEAVVLKKISINRAKATNTIIMVANALSSQGRHSHSVILHLCDINHEVTRIVVVYYFYVSEGRHMLSV